MKLNRRTGILLLLLALPVFIWLFLKFFGQNRYDVPVFYEKGVPLDDNCPGGSQQPHAIPAFSLKKVGGQQTATEDIFNNHISAVYFFSYPCDSICFQVMEELARVQDVFERQHDVQVISINENNADLQHLKALSEKFNRLPGQWSFLAGTSEEVGNLMQCGFVLKGHPEKDHPVVLIDGKRRIRGYYSGTDPADIDRLILEVRILLYTLNQDNA